METATTNSFFVHFNTRQRHCQGDRRRRFPHSYDAWPGLAGIRLSTVLAYEPPGSPHGEPAADSGGYRRNQIRRVARSGLQEAASDVSPSRRQAAWLADLLG